MTASLIALFFIYLQSIPYLQATFQNQVRHRVHVQIGHFVSLREVCVQQADGQVERELPYEKAQHPAKGEVVELDLLLLEISKQI